MIKTHKGGCHCGAVRFECRLDLAPEGERSEPAASGRLVDLDLPLQLRLVREDPFLEEAFVRAVRFPPGAGEDALTHYKFGVKRIDHVFCSRCGIAPFGTATHSNRWVETSSPLISAALTI